MNILIDTARQNNDQAKLKVKSFLEKLKNHNYDNKDIISEIEYAVQKNSGIIRVHVGENEETLLMLLVKENIKYLTNSIVHKILEEYVDIVLLSDKLGNTALIHAAMVNNVDFLEAIPDHVLKNSVDHKNYDNKTAFMFAVQYNHKEFLEKIFEKKVEISKETQEESWRLADECEHYEILSLLKQLYPIKRFFLTTACAVRCLEEYIQFCPETWIKNLLKFSSGVFETVMHKLDYLSNTKLSFIITASKILYTYTPHLLEHLFVTRQRQKYIIQLLYGDRSHHSINSGSDHPALRNNGSENFVPALPIARNQNQGTTTATKFSEYEQNTGTAYRIALVAVKEREIELTRAKADLRVATPKTQEALEKHVNSCKAALMRAQADAETVLVAKEKEELNRSPVQTETPSIYAASAPRQRLWRLPTGSSKSTCTSARPPTLLRTPQGTEGRILRSSSVHKYTSRRSNSLTHNPPSQRSMEMPPLDLLKLPQTMSHCSSSEANWLPASSSQIRSQAQLCRDLTFHKHP
jgi:ankyrin repeat protein